MNASYIEACRPSLGGSFCAAARERSIKPIPLLFERGVAEHSLADLICRLEFVQPGTPGENVGIIRGQFQSRLALLSVTIGGTTYQVPNWLRASIGFTIPVMANFSEIVRGAVQSIPTGQWEAARSLGYKWSRTMLSIILPQCIKRMIPPWMNLYAILLMATPLASIVGVEEAMTNTRTALQAEANSRLLLPMYAYLLAWFFFYCYPIARLSMYLESRFETR